MSKESSQWLKWRQDLEPEELTNFQSAIKKAKRAGKIKLVAAFGVGASLGTGVTAYIAYRLFKSFFGGWLKRGMRF